MNLTERWVLYLKARGWEAEHWARIGDPRAKDSEIADRARIEGWVIVTNDLDFPQILAYTKQNGPSVILLRGEPLTPEARGEELVRLLEISGDELKQGAIASMAWGESLRVRLLPLS